MNYYWPRRRRKRRKKSNRTRRWRKRMRRKGKRSENVLLRRKFKNLGFAMHFFFFIENQNLKNGENFCV